LWAEIEQFNEVNRMEYMASFERKAHQRGIEQGIEQGVGRGQARLLNLLIQQRFGPLSVEVEARLQAATPEQLEAWGVRLLTAGNLEEVFAVEDEPVGKPH
jgi:hypothetical protein